MRWGRVVALGLVLGAAPVWAAVAQPPRAGMPDPRRMSGIPRPDPQVPAGTVTVRCLLGSFAEPATGVTVTLELTAPSGEVTTLTATTGSEGRATFEGVGPAGGQARARATLGGQEVATQPMTLRGDMGTRVLLVRGASTPPAGGTTAGPATGPTSPGGGPHDGAPPHAGGAVPQPGEPFALEGRPAGTLVVGTLDLEHKGRAEGVEVRVRVRPPKGDEQVLKGSSDAQGRVIFEGLVPPKVPAGSELVVEAELRPGEPPQRSKPFEMGDTAMAVYLAVGFDGAAQASGPVQRPPVPGPRTAPGTAPGTVRVRVVDGADRPVAGAKVEIWKKDMTGNDQVFRGETGADGVATVSDVPVQGDAFYFAGVMHDGAPYESTFFRMDDREGVAVDLRVFDVTHDPAVVRSAVQFEVQPRENDQAQVVQIYQVMVEGDRAFWPAEGKLRVEAPEGAHGLVVLRSAGRWLEEKESAPFAVLHTPLPPGEVADLSVAYLLPHSGDLSVRWTAPFPLVESSVILPKELALADPKVAPKTPPHATPGAEAVDLYSFGPRPLGASVEFRVAGLPERPKVFRVVAWGLAGLIMLGTGLAVARRPRGGRRSRLLALRDELWARLARNPPEAERARIVAALDDLYRKLDELEPKDP